MNKFSSFKEYISEIDFDLFLEMAAHSGQKSVGGASHLLDNDTLHYLHQFHPKDHARALEFRLGKGMHDASKERHAAIQKHLEEKYPDLSDDERWMKHTGEPHNPIDAMDAASGRHKEEGVFIKGDGGETYYKIPKLSEIVEGNIESFNEKFSPQEIDIMSKGYFKPSQLKAMKLKIDDIEKRKWEITKVKSKKGRRYHADTNLKTLAKKLEGHHLSREELKNAKLDPETWHNDYSDHDHEFNTPDADYSHPNSPDFDSLSDEDKKKIRSGDRAHPYEFGAAGAVSHGAIKTALKDLKVGTALGVLGDHRGTFTDREGVEHETELHPIKDAKHGGHFAIVAQSSSPEWSSTEERMDAFDDLHKELKILEGKKHFHWKVIEFVNKDEGSSITVDGPTSSNDLTAWVNGSKKWDADSASFKKGNNPPVKMMCVDKGCRKPKFESVHVEGTGALHIPHIKNKVKYKEVETIGDVEISSVEKEDEVLQPVTNMAKYIIQFKKCLSASEVLELGIYKLKDPNNPELEKREVEWSDLKMTGGAKTVQRGGAAFIFSHWNKLSDSQKKCMTTYTNAHLNLMRKHGPAEFERRTGGKHVHHTDVSSIGGITPGTNNTQAHHPLHKHTPSSGFMNKEYDALYKVAVLGDESAVVSEQKSDIGIKQNVLAMHNGPVWKEATESIYRYIQSSTHVSGPMKATMLSNLEFIVRHAVSRIIENLGHDEVGLGFERVVGEDGKVKFTYDPNKDSGDSGKKARKKEAIRWVKSYAQTDHGSGTRRLRQSVGSLSMGGDTESEESNIDVSDEDLNRRVTQNEKGQWEALAHKSDWHGAGHSRHDIIRRQRGAGLAEMNKKWEKNENNIQNKLNQEIAKWLNNNPGKIITHAIVDDLLEKMFEDKEWLKAKGLDHINPETITDELEKIKAIATKSSTEKVSDVQVDPTAGLELDNQTQQFFDLFKNLAEEGKVTYAGKELSLKTVRDEKLDDFESLYKATKKSIEESLIDENEKNSLLKSLKNYWDKIIETDEPKTTGITTDIPTDAQMKGLDYIHNQLDGVLKIRVLTKNQQAGKDKIEKLEKSMPGGSIEEYLKIFDQASKNPTKAMLRTRLELIRNKLNELQKVA